MGSSTWQTMYAPCISTRNIIITFVHEFEYVHGHIVVFQCTVEPGCQAVAECQVPTCLLSKSLFAKAHTKIYLQLKLSMHARAFGVRDVMKLMGVVNFASAPGCEAPKLLLFPHKHRCLTIRFYGIHELLVTLKIIFSLL